MRAVNTFNLSPFSRDHNTSDNEGNKLTLENPLTLQLGTRRIAAGLEPWLVHDTILHHKIAE